MLKVFLQRLLQSLWQPLEPRGECAIVELENITYRVVDLSIISSDASEFLFRVDLISRHHSLPTSSRRACGQPRDILSPLTSHFHDCRSQSWNTSICFYHTRPGGQAWRCAVPFWAPETSSSGIRLRRRAQAYRKSAVPSLPPPKNLPFPHIHPLTLPYLHHLSTILDSVS